MFPSIVTFKFLNQSFHHWSGYVNSKWHIEVKRKWYELLTWDFGKFHFAHLLYLPCSIALLTIHSLTLWSGIPSPPCFCFRWIYKFTNLWCWSFVFVLFLLFYLYVVGQAKNFFPLRPRMITTSMTYQKGWPVNHLADHMSSHVRSSIVEVRKEGGKTKIFETTTRM